MSSLYFVQALREVYKSKSNIVILDCSKDILVEVLREAQQVSIVSETYFYLLTSLDSHTVDLEPFTVRNRNKTHIIVYTRVKFTVILFLVSMRVNSFTNNTH